MSNICPSCKKETYEQFSGGSYFSYAGSHCIDCGYYKAKKNGDEVEGFAVLVQCEKCKEEQWLPDFPRGMVIMVEDSPLPYNLPSWQCLNCNAFNNVLTTIKRKKP